MCKITRFFHHPPVSLYLLCKASLLIIIGTFIIFNGYSHYPGNKDLSLLLRKWNLETKLNFKTNESSNVSMMYTDFWSCDELQRKIQVASSWSSGIQTPELTSNETPYCIQMIEAYSKCIGFTKDDAHLFPNAFLSFHGQHQNTWKDWVKQYRKINIYFIHVMKCSGTSVEHVIRKAISPSHYTAMGLYFCSDIIRTMTKTRTKPFFTFDKRSYGVHRVIDDPAMYIIFLREPIDRFISMYWYIKNRRYPTVLADHLLEPVLQSKNLSEFLRQTRNNRLPFFDDHSIRLLQFDNNPETLAAYSGGPDAYIPSKTPIVPIAEKHYSGALKVLHQCAFVGITEQSEISQKMLSFILTDATTFTVNTNVNKGYNKNDVTAEDVAEIKRRTYWDQKLYEKALQIFEIEKKIYNSIINVR